MFGSIFSFEIKRLLKTPATYIYFLILFIVTFFVGLMVGGAFTEVKINFAGEKILANAPFVVDNLLTAINSWIGAIIVVAIIGNAVLKDFRYNTHNLVFTTPISKFDYLFGRFSASFIICLLVLTGPAFGLMMAFSTPWVNADRIGPFLFQPYLLSYLQSIVPNALLQGAIFFAVSLMARDIFVIWLSLLLLWIGIGVSNSLFSSLQYETISALADPLGSQAKRAITKYWSSYDKNHRLYPFTGLFLLNRLVWLSVAASIFVAGYLSFSFTSTARRLSFRKKKIGERQSVNVFSANLSGKISLPTVRQSFTTKSHLGNLWGLAVNECKTLLRNIYFRIIVLFGLLFLLLTSMQLGKIYDTATLPVTYQVIEAFGGAFQLFIVILTIVFGGEIIWRARENRMDNILDALPVPNWVFYTSKLIGLLFMQTLLLLVIMGAGIVVQLFHGYTHLEPGLYLQYLFGIKLIDLWLLAVLCVFIHSLVPNKYLGYFLVILFYVWNTFFAGLVLKHNLFVFMSDPGIVYSDMNAFGHSIYPFIVYKAYWGAFALILAAISVLYWARGADVRLGKRFLQLETSERKRAFAVIGVAALVFIGCGGFIYYNTNILNKHYSQFDAEEIAVQFEKKYKKYETRPQPKLSAVLLNVDLYPAEQSVHATGRFTLENKTRMAVDTLHILFPDGVDIRQLSFSRKATLVMNDTINGYRMYRLSQTMLPGDTIAMNFDVNKASEGFQHDFTGLGTPLYNGTFINNQGFLPSIGYDNNAELSDNAQRKKHGLGYRATANKITDSAEFKNNVFTHDADFIDFEATVSTVPDQIAVAPGYLKKEWINGNRRYFNYKMDAKILNFYSFLSARYKVKHDKWKETNIEIYYQPGHEYNLDRMLNGIKKSLSYYAAHFSPYQHRQVRILEFPRYAAFAQSFPNTIPFSEGIGFIADVDDDNKEDLDYVFYVTAHEVAHQWFAHQVVGANVEGSNLLSETLAQYGSITVMENEYGSERIRKFLHLEMDKYLTARSNESEKEKPLALADAGQGYILYQKGGVLMHSLRKYIGAAKVDSAMAAFIAEYAYKAAPYPTSYNLVATLLAFTPDSLKYIVNDAFNNITLYDNKVKELHSRKDGTNFIADVTIDINKYYADSTGKETAAACNDYVDVAIYKDSKTIMQINRYKLTRGLKKLSIQVPSKPYKVVIDPDYLLIDKKPGDNELRADVAPAITGNN